MAIALKNISSPVHYFIPVNINVFVPLRTDRPALMQSYVGHSTSRLFFIIISFVFTSNIFWLLISLNLQPSSIISLLQPGCSRCVCVATARVGQGLLIHEVSRSHTTTHHSRYDSSGRVISLSQRPPPENTQQSQQTDIHAHGGIRTHDLSRRAGAATGTGFEVGIRHLNMKTGSAGTIAQYDETPASNYGVHPSIRLWSYSPFGALASLTRCLHSSSEASLRFSEHRFFPRMGSLPSRTTPNLEDQGVPFCLGHHLRHVRLGWPCQ
jgi:hypothetical protein